MAKCLDTVDGDDRNIVLILAQQFPIGFNINYGERIFVAALGCFNRPLRFVAKVTTGTAVDDYVGFVPG